MFELASTKQDSKQRLTRWLREEMPGVGIFLVWCLTLASTVLGFILAGGLRQFILGLDFRAYYTAGRMALGGVSSSFYDLATQWQWQSGLAPELPDMTSLLPFINPPFVAAGMMPVAWLPLEQAYVIWAAANLLLLVWMARLMLSSLGSASRRARLGLLAMILTFLPVAVAVIPGQLSFFLVLSFLLSWRSFKAGKDYRGGLWLALLLIKPQLVLVPAIVLLYKGKIRALAGLATGGFVALVSSLLLVGWDGLLGYFNLVMRIPLWGDAFGVHPQDMQTWRGFLSLLMNTNRAKDVDTLWLMGVAVAVGLLLWGWRGSWKVDVPRFDLQWALIPLVSVFVSPHANWHDLSVLLVTIMLAMRYGLHHHWKAVLDKCVGALPLLIYLAVWISPVGAVFLRTQLSVLLSFVALLAMVVALRASKGQYS